jgi:hypothetical protein
MMSDTVTLFTAPGSTACAAVQSFLRSESLPFTALDTTVFKARYAAALQYCGEDTLPPLIFVGARRVDLPQLVFYARSRPVEQQQQQQQQSPRPQPTDSGGDAVVPPPPLPPFLGPLSPEEAARNERSVRRFTSRLAEPSFDVARDSGAPMEPKTYTTIFTRIRGAGGVTVADRGLLWHEHDCFLASELVDTLLRTVCHRGATRGGATTLAQELHRCRMFAPIDPATETFRDVKELWRFTADHGTCSLNRSRIFFATCPADFALLSSRDTPLLGAADASADAAVAPRNAALVAAELRLWLAQLVDRHTTMDGVDYAAVRAEPEFWAFAEATAELQTSDLSSLSRAEKIAFGINVYHTGVLHGFIYHGPPQGLLQIRKFFNAVGYCIGRYHYTLSDVANGFLRGNRKGLGALRVPFSKKDPRLQFAVENPDYRIHFALNCGAASCPPLRVYSAKHLDQELQQAANSFMATNHVFDPVKRWLKVSRIVLWYGEDFAAPGTTGAAAAASIVGTCLKHLPPTTVAECNEVGIDNIVLDYYPFDWADNAVPPGDKDSRPLLQR